MQAMALCLEVNRALQENEYLVVDDDDDDAVDDDDWPPTPPFGR